MNPGSDRYTIGDPTCGLIETESTKIGALRRSLKMAGLHRTCGPLTVFDAMAHHGKPQLWKLDGTVLEYKK